MKQGKKFRKKWLWILAGVLCICVVLGALWLSFNGNIFFEEKTNSTPVEGGGSTEQIDDRTAQYSAPDSDIGEIKSGSSSKYMMNIVTVLTVKESTPAEVEKILEKYGAKVVGYILDVNMFTVKLNRSYSYNELKNVWEGIGAMDEFEHAGPNIISEDTINFTPNGSKWNKPEDSNTKWNGVAGANYLNLFTT